MTKTTGQDDTDIDNEGTDDIDIDNDRDQGMNTDNKEESLKTMMMTTTTR